MNNLKNCPVCKKGFLKQGLKNHIINSAGAEAYKVMKNILKHNKRGRVEFSSIVLLRNNPHLGFVMKNYKQSKKEILEI